MESLDSTALYALHTYNVYANDLVLETAAKISAEELTREVSPSHGSVLKLLAHIFECEYYFTLECMNTTPDQAQADRCAASLESLRECFALLNATRENYLEQVNEFELGEEITVDLGRGEVTLPRWQFMAQSLLHSAHHRGELSIVMTELGYPLPTLDPILMYIRDSGQVFR
ncbi:MAG: DinB family protein [Anaerolineaceae bacterium]|jgi:uncharacterized damage-inducible protein DinB